MPAAPSEDRWYNRLMDRELSVKVCRFVAGLLVTDDDLDPKEDAFIERMLARFGIPATDRDLIFPIVDGAEAATMLREMPANVRDEAVDLLIQAAAADGKIAPEERGYLETVSDAVGLARGELEKRLARALSGG